MTDTDSPDDVDMEEDFMIPLTDIDNNFMPAFNKGEDDDDETEDENEEKENKFEFKPLLTRRARRRSLLTGTPLPQLSKLEAISNAGFKPSKPIPMAKSPLSPTKEDCSYSMSPKVKVNWMRILKKVKSMEDPWQCYNIDELPTEVVTRHRYNALRKKWVIDEVEVKVESAPFNHGAMRSCFRLKKLSTFSRSKDWSHASNYVAKRYMENVERDVYFEDVKLQMDAKLWGEEYSRHNPPKKVDIFQMCALEFKNRPDAPLYHLEHFIEGKYIKYNSNSGFVEESLRLTPQAFSHFTFERSGHNLIVVDVQGVGDLWTDPQIHTSDGEGYGDGNLGTRGMALFFHSHICNSICKSLHLSKFDLATSEIINQVTFIKAQKDAVTQVRGSEQHCYSASPIERADLTGFLMRSRSRTTSMASQTSQASSEELMSPVSFDMADDMDLDDEPVTPDSPLPYRRPRIRLQSESSDSSSTITEEEERIRFQEALNRSHRPSCIAAEINLLNLRNLEQGVDSTLGQIHHEIAKYHELGRFAKDDNEIDYEAALFHEEQAANLGVIEAQLTLARLYLGMHREVLTSYNIEENNENTNKGVMYMELAAEAGDRASMIYIAGAYETGLGLGTLKSRNHDLAAKWYEKAIETSKSEGSGEFDATMDHPVYMLQAKVAELFLNGEYCLDKDVNYAGEMYTAAAEGAMEAMKGRLANKYYSLAEEAWALVEED